MVKSFFFLILTMYTQHHIANGIRDTYRCDFIDTFDPDWVDYEHYESLTRIECGTLCYERRWSCMYWGYNGSCYLLKNSVDKDKCSKEDCSSPGMKIYKGKLEVTTTEAPLLPPILGEEKTTTTTTAKTTEAEQSSAATTTTTTEKSAEEDLLASTTNKETDLTSEKTTSDDASSTTETTTASPSSSTSSDEESTTEDAYTTTEGGWSCDPPDGAEAEIYCPDNNFLLRAMGSKSPFFGDALSASCTNMYEQVFGDDEKVLTFFSPDGGITIEAMCPDKNHVIVKFKLCVMDAHIPAITIHCRFIKDPDRIEERYNATSDEMKHAFVDCEENGALQKMYFMDSGNGVVTRVVFSCLKVHVPEKPVPVGI